MNTTQFTRLRRWWPKEKRTNVLIQVVASVAAISCGIAALQFFSNSERTDSAYTAASNSQGNGIIGVVPSYRNICTTTKNDYGVGEDGRVYYGSGSSRHWSLSDWPELTNTTMKKLACNNTYMAGLDVLGDVYVWENTPETITKIDYSFATGEHIIDIVATVSSFSVLTSTGRVFSFGNNNNGQLGKGDLAESPADSTVPYELQFPPELAGTKLEAIAASLRGLVGLTSTGTLIQWGRNYETSSSSGLAWAVSPVGALKGKTFVSVGASDQVTLALDTDGVLYSWGTGAALGRDSSDLLPPDAVNSFGTIAKRAISRLFTTWNGPIFVLLNDGTLHAWGNGALGDGTETGPGLSLVPLETDMSGVLAGKTITTVVPGSFSSMVLVAEDQALYWWGFGWFIAKPSQALPQRFAGSQQLLPN